MRGVIEKGSFVFWALLVLVCCAQSGICAETTLLSGKVVATVIRSVPVPFNAVVDKVMVKPGDAVNEGTVLLQYHLQDEASYTLQREVTAGAGTENLKSQVLDLESKLGEVSAERNKARQLANTGLGSKQALARMEGDVTSLQSRIKLLNGTIERTERNFASRLKELESYFGSPVKEGEDLPQFLVLKSPISGHVLSLDSSLHKGSVLAAGNMPIRVGQLDSVYIQVPVYEADINAMKVGDVAEVEIPSLDNRRFEAKITEIAWISTDMHVDRPSYYTVELSVPNPKLELKPGFKAVIRFVKGQNTH